MSGSTLTLWCSCCGTRLWVKLHTSAKSKAIRIAVPTVLGELRCGHITSVSLGWAGVSCFGVVSGVLRRMGNPVAVLKLELRVTTKTDF